MRRNARLLLPAFCFPGPSRPGHLLCLFLLLVLLPAGPAPAHPSSPSEDQEVRWDVEGTVWTGMDSDGDRYTFRFLPGGILNYTSPSGTFQNGTWRQRHDIVYVEMNGRYAEYTGRLQGDRIHGEAHNVRGKRWTWHVRHAGTVAGRS
jgi:hypothetical protein